MYHIAYIFCDLKLDETYGWWNSFDLHKKVVGDSVSKSELSNQKSKKVFFTKCSRKNFSCLLSRLMDLSVHKITTL